MMVKTWQHEGMLCCIRKNYFGAPCGYVRVPEGHPLFKADWKKLEQVPAYGDVTFRGNLEEDPSLGWFIGFDMAHACDISYEGGIPKPIRTIEECESLTEKLAEFISSFEEGEANDAR